MVALQDVKTLALFPHVRTIWKACRRIPEAEGNCSLRYCQFPFQEKTMRKLLMITLVALLFASACQKTEETPPPAAEPEAPAASAAAPAASASAPAAAPSASP